ncbi:arsenate reductase (glutaredoxin) [Defluviimonas sp. WL0002]|uniref:Arsenate reductase n=1 Tax=Albidovulum marisflavi TaxID=2984159 RepID=A0ABT2ZAX6_9RHOB|nr:arsenate reductase (glutaredoxin) [Defluviimonas sp. WL0002]MCV2868283.1 arsenate reductase (glutaredoxin) [Defluviimonas sp. WL0002]
MAETVIWHNPRCSKSRETLNLLRDRGVDPRVRLYLEDAPSVAEIGSALAALGRPAGDLVRWKEPAVRDLGLTRFMPEAELIAALAATPALIERPLVLHDGKAALGRPPEAVLSLFQLRGD